MKKLYFVVVDTEWCGTENHHYVLCKENEIDLISDELAYDNYIAYAYEDDDYEETDRYSSWRYEEFDIEKHLEYFNEEEHAEIWKLYNETAN